YLLSGTAPLKQSEVYARGIVTLFPSLKDPYSKKGYEHFYDAASSTGYISWRLKTVQRKILHSHQIAQLTFLQEAQIGKGLLMLKGSLMVMLAKRPCLCLTIQQTIPVTFEKFLVNSCDCLSSAYDQEMASLLLLLHLLPPPPGGLKSPKNSACDAVERLVVFHKSCCSLEEHLRNQQGRQPYLLAVGRQKSKIDSFYITMDKRLIPCKANRSLGACDELFKAHFVFNLSYDVALVNFYTFLQTTVYNIDVGKMKESPRVKDLRARLLNQPVAFSPCE
uniref:uncharacterized protein LOC120832177 n=1 Tax=Gasterosteus aculeatus aculeatus TaxID=481459 RepID=UPI001A988105